jgi:hypothetical protein
MKNGKKAVAIFALAGMMFQFGGCANLALKEIVVGFGRSIGELPAQIVNDVFLADFLNGLTGNDGNAAE